MIGMAIKEEYPLTTKTEFVMNPEQWDRMCDEIARLRGAVLTLWGEASPTTVDYLNETEPHVVRLCQRLHEWADHDD